MTELEPEDIDYRLYDAEPEDISSDMVRGFLRNQYRDRLFSETTTLEFKRQTDAYNVVEAICALANTEGGLVLVGVDEKNPTKLPGVALSEQDRILSHCSSVLDPAFTPIIVPVPADNPDRVVLVIRVDQEVVPVRPVLCRGAVYLRAPNRTYRANREQLASLFSQPELGPSWHGQAAPFTTASAPPHKTGMAEQDSSLPALCARVCGGLLLRKSATEQRVLSSAMRAELAATIDASEFAKWATGVPNHEYSTWQLLSTSPSSWEARRTLPRRFAPAIDLHSRASIQGQFLSYYVDLEIRESDWPNGVHDDGSTRLAHLADGVYRQMKLVAIDLPATVARRLVVPPRGHEPLAMWIFPKEQDLYRFALLDHYPRHDLPNHQRVTTAYVTTSAATADELRRAWHERLEELCFEDGIIDPELVAERIVSENIPEVLARSIS